MTFEYNSSTRQAYRDAEVANEYDRSFRASLGWRTLRFRLIAHGEQKSVRNFLRRVPGRRVLDLPCGTGKLANVFAAETPLVQAADISPEMLAVAKTNYARAGLAHVHFWVCDAESVSRQFVPGAFDAIVCLRLMHRVPPEVRLRMLQSMAAVARYCIVSYAVDSSFHRWRRRVRSWLLRVPQQSICAASLKSIRAEIGQHFRIRASSWVAPLLSEEIIFLIEAPTGG